MTPQTYILARQSQIPALVAVLGEWISQGPVRVTVGARPSKTREQNAYLHLAIRQLANHVGMSESDLKDLLKSEYGPEDTLRVGSVCGVVKKSMSKYSLEEAANMIEHVERIAAECGLLLEPTGSL